MSNYRSQYQNYYGSINKKTPSRTGVNGVRLNLNQQKSVGKNNTINRIINKLIKQLVGTLFLLAILMIIKYIPLEEAQDIYVFSKESVDKNIDLKEVIMNFNIQEFEEYKEKIWGAIEGNMNQ